MSVWIAIGMGVLIYAYFKVRRRRKARTSSVPS